MRNQTINACGWTHIFMVLINILVYICKFQVIFWPAYIYSVYYRSIIYTYVDSNSRANKTVAVNKSIWLVLCSLLYMRVELKMFQLHPHISIAGNIKPIVDSSMEHNVWNRAYIYSREQNLIYIYIRWVLSLVYR